MTSFDVIVIGLGAMGGAAAYHCAKRGLRVLGLDANPPCHALGSSHGTTRAIRETYFEAPEYVPLVQRSYELWADLERDFGHPLLTTTGALYLAPKQSPLLRGVTAAADQFNLAYERLAPAQVADRFPGFKLPSDFAAVYESRGGILQAEVCLKAHVELARRLGADLRFGLAARKWRRTTGGIVVTTAAGEFEASNVILTLEPWACEALGDIELPLTGRRVTVVHFDAFDSSAYDAATLSVYFWATPQGVFAGFPHVDGEGVKVMRHDAGDVCTPATVRREVSDSDVDEVAQFLDRYMPLANRRVRRSYVCLYTMTPDNHFIVDRHPELPGLVYAGGFYGHGFKFAPVIGEILADLTIDGATDHPIGFLSADRFRSPARVSAESRTNQSRDQKTGSD